MNRNSNPFEVDLSASWPELEHEESLDSIIGEIRRINRMNFDTWYQMLFKFIAWFIPSISWKRDVVYDVDDDTGYVYMGPERRKTVRLHTEVIQKLATVVTAVRVQLMPKTLKITPIDKEVA